MELQRIWSEDPQVGHVHHPLHSRGGVPVEQGGGAGAQAGQGAARDRHRPAFPADRGNACSPKFAQLCPELRSLFSNYALRGRHERAHQIHRLPLLLLAALLVLWFIANRYLGVPYYVLPPVEGVLAALYRGYVQGDFWGDFGFTLASMAIGYVGGCTAAFIIGVLFAEYRWLERLLYPFVLALQSMPKVAPGPADPGVVRLRAGVQGHHGGPGLFLPHVHQHGGGPEGHRSGPAGPDAGVLRQPLAHLTRIKIPSAASHIFAALQISVVLGLIGAVVAEFVSSSKGLGYLINAATTTLDTSTMFAALISLAVLGIAGSQLIRALHRKLVFWDRGDRTDPHRVGANLAPVPPRRGRRSRAIAPTPRRASPAQHRVERPRMSRISVARSAPSASWCSTASAPPSRPLIP